MYKNFSSAIIAAIMACSVSAQNNRSEVDQRLIDHFGIDHITHLQQNAPNVLEQYSFYLDHAVQIIEINEKDLSILPHISEIEAKEGTLNTIPLAAQIAQNNINPLAFYLDQKETAFTYYRIGTGNLVLAVLPRSVYYRRYDEYRGASYE